MLLDELLGLIRVETGKREHALNNTPTVGIISLDSDGSPARERVTDDLLLDMTPILPPGRGGRLELVIEQLEQGIPHLDDPTRHGGNIPFPRVEQFRVGQDHRDLPRDGPQCRTSVPGARSFPSLWRGGTHDMSSVSGRVRDFASLQDGQLGLDPLGLLGISRDDVQGPDSFVVQPGVLGKRLRVVPRKSADVGISLFQ
jgi:hypothetical protein